MSQFREATERHSRVIESLLLHEETIAKIVETLVTAVSGGGKVLIMGNGGSASDAQHFAGELIGRFKKNRRAFAAVSLVSDSAVVTAIANDFGYEEIFSRQVEGLAKPGDVVIGFSTSGNSVNVIKAVEEARRLHCTTIGFLGKNGGALAGLVDIPLIVDSDDTAHIQEAHIVVYHYVCGAVENALS